MSTRRTFLESLALGGLATLATRTGVVSAQTAGREGVRVLRDAVDLGRQLRGSSLTVTGWQDQVEPLMRRCSVAELMSAIDLPALRAQARPVSRGASILRVPLFHQLGADEGADVKIFFLREGRSDPPHVHFNLVAAHIVLEGRFRVRHFDRLSEARGGFIIQQTHDRVLNVGEVSSISDERNNGHWHHALSDGVLLDVQQGRIDPSLPIRRREMIDPEPEPAASPDASFFARRLSRARALRRYG